MQQGLIFWADDYCRRSLLNCQNFFYLNVINAEVAGLSIVCNLIQLVASICLLVLDIKMMHGISKSFGHGTGFTVGLVLLPFIFQLVLGFGSSEYRPVNKGKSK